MKDKNANKPSYILNPVSDRWVKRTGPTGIFVIEFWKVCKKSKPKPKPKNKNPKVTVTQYKAAEAKIKAGEFSTAFQDKITEMQNRYGIKEDDFGFKQKKKLSPIKSQQVNTLVPKRKPPVINTLVPRRKPV